MNFFSGKYLKQEQILIILVLPEYSGLLNAGDPRVSFWLCAAAAKSLQLCLTLCDPIDSSPPGSSVPGFSRQEHWNGLPFPSPMHESAKWKWSRSVVSNSSRPHRLQPTRLLCPWDFPGKSTGEGCHRLLPSICWTKLFTVLVTQSCSTLCDPWIVAHQVHLSMGFSRQKS